MWIIKRSVWRKISKDYIEHQGIEILGRFFTRQDALDWIYKKGLEIYYTDYANREIWLNSVTR